MSRRQLPGADHRPQLRQRVVHQWPEGGGVVLFHPTGEGHLEDGHPGLGGEDGRVAGEPAADQCCGDGGGQGLQLDQFAFLQLRVG